MNVHAAPFVVGGALLLLLIWAVGNYNALVRLRQNIRESWTNIDVQLRRRYDLIPNLVETVKGYAAHERELLERVVRARNEARSHKGDAEYERPMVDHLRQVMAVAERYPELKADQHFLELQEELADTEDRIAAARRFFNGNVRDYNSRRESFPSSIIAGLFGFQPRGFWEVREASQRERPDVEL